MKETLTEQIKKILNNITDNVEETDIEKSKYYLDKIEENLNLILTDINIQKTFTEKEQNQKLTVDSKLTF